jgi:peptide/nickel transport system permease protein
MRNLLRYAITRILLTIPMLLILLTLVFVVLRVMPGDPVSAMLGGHAPDWVIEERKEQLGLNRPIVVQYFEYLGQLARLDLGNSMIFNQKVTQPIKEKLAATLELTLTGMLFTLLIGVPLGAYAASRRRTGQDFGIRLKWLPVSGRTSARLLVSTFEITGFYTIDTLIRGNLPALWDVIVHLFLPSLTLGLVLSGVFVRLTRANMLDVLKSDYVLAARARGIPERRVVYRHALKNAFIPILTMLGLQFAILLSGAILTENTFSWPGMGRLLVERIYLRDYPTVQGVIAVFAIMVSAISLLVDLIYALIDPRVRY